MQNVVFAAIGIILLVLENLWRMNTILLRGAPELVFLLVLFLSLSERTMRGVLYAFVLGFCQDSLTGNLPGMFIIIYVTAFFLLDATSNMFFPRRLIFQIPAVAVFTVLAYLSRASFMYFFHMTDARYFALLADLPRQLAFNIGAAFVLYPILQSLEDATDPEKEKNIFSSRSW